MMTLTEPTSPIQALPLTLPLNALAVEPVNTGSSELEQSQSACAQAEMQRDEALLAVRQLQAKLEKLEVAATSQKKSPSQLDRHHIVFQQQKAMLDIIDTALTPERLRRHKH